MVRVPIRLDGRVVEVDALTGRERFRFQACGVDEELECAVTPGMPSFIHTRPELRSFAEKTIRWPGHYDAIQTLKECGLLALEPVDVDGRAVVPRKVLSAVLTPRLLPGPGEGDVCVMWNTVEGTKGGRRARVDYYLWDEADRETGISSMARVTGFSAAIGARMLAEGRSPGRGSSPPRTRLPARCAGSSSTPSPNGGSSSRRGSRSRRGREAGLRDHSRLAGR